MKMQEKKEEQNLLFLISHRRKIKEIIYNQTESSAHSLVDSLLQKFLFYENKKYYGKAHQCSGNIILDQSIVTDRLAIQLYNDRQDCFIDIFSPEVLLLFTDNFDYQQLRRGFVKGLLSDEVMGYKIFTSEIHSEYAARIENFRGYDAVSKDIL